MKLTQFQQAFKMYSECLDAHENNFIKMSEVFYDEIISLLRNPDNYCSRLDQESITPCVDLFESAVDLYARSETHIYPHLLKDIYNKFYSKTKCVVPKQEYELLLNDPRLRIEQILSVWVKWEDTIEDQDGYFHDVHKNFLKEIPNRKSIHEIPRKDKGIEDRDWERVAA